MSLFDIAAAKSEIGADANAKRAKRANPENETPEISTISTISTGEPANSENENLDALFDPGMEKRRQEVLQMLRESPEIARAWIADGEADPVTIHLAVRGVGSCELSIAVDKWDEFKFLELMDKQGGTA